MNTKQWTVFFVALLSVDYATAFFFGGYKGVPKTYAEDNEGYYGWSQGCRCNDDLTSSLDGALENARSHLGKSRNGYSLKDTNLEEYEFTGGNIRGLHKFERKGLYRCSLSRKNVRIYFRMGFPRLLAYYYVSFAEDIFGGFLGGVFSAIGNAFGRVADYLFRMAFSDVYVTCVLSQRLGSRQGFELEGLYMNNIENISFLNKRFSRHQDSVGSYFRPIFDHVLRHFFHGEFSRVFTRYFSRVTAEREMFYYESSSRKRHGGYNRGRQYEKGDGGYSGGRQYEESDGGYNGERQYEESDESGERYGYSEYSESTEE